MKDQFEKFKRLMKAKERADAAIAAYIPKMDRSLAATNSALIRAVAMESKGVGKELLKASKLREPKRRGRPMGSKNRPVENAEEKPAKKVSKKAASKKPASKKASSKPVSKKPVGKKPTSKKPVRHISPVSLAGSKLPTTAKTVKARSHHKKVVATVAPEIAGLVGTDPTLAASQS